MTKKKKIGIVTITNDGYNFGNRLQNYALQTVLERMGFEVETLNRPIRDNQRNWWKRKKMVLHYFLPYHQRIEHLKAGNFFFWNLRHIHWSKIVATDENLSTLAKQYDYFVAGSDQIWNPKFSWGTTPYMFLQFALPKQRVSYAASIGIDDEFKEPYCSQFKDMWKDWKALSCREQFGARIMSDLLNQEVPCLLDPTLLLDRKDWEDLTRGCRTPKKYIFLYMLGELTGEYQQYVFELAERTGCQVVDVMNDIRYARCSPSRFAALIQRADWVVADSYHAMVFSIIFHKRFTFVYRKEARLKCKNMNSRVHTLTDKLKLQLHQVDDKPIFELNILDGDAVNLLIEEHKAIALNYLKCALK
ncbi:MAG: polysaccharide pyruvyl transferase family protein [Bacteroidia bacterium]|nr:polysaccharide pyruvyl transferase family protein [Bacteroidia bacterium]